MPQPFSIEKLKREHIVEGFDSGSENLNQFLVRYAFINQLAGASQTYLGFADQAVVGFYTLAVGQVSYEDSSQRLTKGLARHPVPIMLLARLAVSKKWQKRGLGSGLLKDAMCRTLRAADIAGIRAFAVHAKDEVASEFYRHFDFQPSPTDPYHLFLLLKDVRRLVEG